MKVIKLTDQHYIIVDNSEIKEGDWIYNAEREPSILECIGKGSLRGWQKITHSTKPLIDFDFVNGHTSIKYIPLQEVKELIGEVDVEMKAEEYGKSIGNKNGTAAFDYKRGYNQALEDNKEKKYTEEDIDKAYWAGMQFVGEDKGSFGEFIQSLKPKTEWEIEFVDGKLKLK